MSSAQAELNESYFPAFRTAVRESSPTGVMCCAGLPLVLPSACLCNLRREGGAAKRLRSGGRVAVCTIGCCCSGLLCGTRAGACARTSPRLLGPNRALAQVRVQRRERRARLREQDARRRDSRPAQPTALAAPRPLVSHS